MNALDCDIPFLPAPFLRDLTLQDFPFLTSLAQSESAGDRRIWLRVASDHFVAAEPNAPEAIEAFAEVMASQLEAADPATRLDIARKLAPCARTPLRLLVKLEGMDAELSDFVLEHAAAYSEQELKHGRARARKAIAVARQSAEPRACEPAHLPRQRRRADRACANAFAQLETAAMVRLLRRREAGRKSAATCGSPKRFSNVGRSGRTMGYSSCSRAPISGWRFSSQRSVCSSAVLRVPLPRRLRRCSMNWS